MGKRFKGKPCAYCGKAGGTADHVIAREFFLVEHRADLPQVSACSPCNSEKSRLEHFLLSVLPFGGSGPTSTELLVNAVPKRLARNAKLHRTLAEGMQPILAEQDGVARETMALPFDGQALRTYFCFVLRGLVQFHWNVLLGESHFIGAGLIVREAEEILEGLMRMNPNAYARGDLGKGTIRYEGVQAVGDPMLTFWRFQLYNGVAFAGMRITLGLVRPQYGLPARLSR